MGFSRKIYLSMRIAIFILFLTFELLGQRYYSRAIFDKLIVSSAPAANAMAFPSGANPSPRKFVSMGSGVTMGATTEANGINHCFMAKNDNQKFSCGFSGGGTTRYNYTGNQGTSFTARTAFAATGYSRCGISGDGSRGAMSRAATSGLWYYGPASSLNASVISGATGCINNVVVLNNDGSYMWGFRNSATTGYRMNPYGTNGTFTFPWAVSDADYCPTNGRLWIVRNSGGHTIAYSTDNGSNWTSIAISASTTQTNPMIRASEDNQKIFVVFDVNNAYSSTDGGSSWTGPFALPTGFSTQTLAATKTLATIGACKSTSNGEFFYSTDMGATWTTKTDGSTGVPFTALVLWD